MLLISPSSGKSILSQNKVGPHRSRVLVPHVKCLGPGATEKAQIALLMLPVPSLGVKNGCWMLSPEKETAVMFLPEINVQGFGGLEPSLCIFWKGLLAPSGPGRILAPGEIGSDHARGPHLHLTAGLCLLWGSTALSSKGKVNHGSLIKGLYAVLRCD